jgi:hypothetical protein
MKTGAAEEYHLLLAAATIEKKDKLKGDFCN